MLSIIHNAFIDPSFQSKLSRAMENSVQVLYSTPDQSKSGSACHMTRSANHRRHSENSVCGRVCVMWSGVITTLAIESTTQTALVTLIHHDARGGGSIPGLSSFSTTAPNNGSFYR